MVNLYMSNGIPITPITSMHQVNGMDNTSTLLLTNVTQHDRQLPVDLSMLRDVVLLD